MTRGGEGGAHAPFTSSEAKRSGTAARSRQVVRVLAIGGLEPTGRMGLLTDLATISAMGAQGVGIASALTAQGTKTFAVEPVPVKTVVRQLRAALEVGPIDAVKLGMIPDAGMLRAIRRALRDLEVPWVVDPVVRSSSGKRLSTLGPGDYRALARAQVVITPNVPEATWLLGRRAALDEQSLEAVALELLELGFAAVVLKGGHRLDQPTDLVAEQGSVAQLRGRTIPRGPDKRGTGCRYGSALAVELARGHLLKSGARAAKRHVARYLSR